MRRQSILVLAALLAAPASVYAQDSGTCERHWTFPVPFYQSIAWSPDGSRVAFSAVTTTWDDGYGIFLANADGTGLRRIDTGDAPALYPVFSPDGSRIAFSSKQTDNNDIWVIALDGSGATRLTRHEANDGYPSWSPDGARIAFHSNRDGNYEIYVMNADGSEPMRLTEHPADDYNPAWSRDGSRIAFDSDRDEVEGDEIYVVSPTGADLAQVVEAGVFPTWSPDGDKILFTQKGLFMVGVDGSSPARLLEDAVYGAWSPDGSSIAAAAIDFDQNCKDLHSLVLLGADGVVRKKLLP